MITPATVDHRIDTAVAKAVAQMEAQHQQDMQNLLADYNIVRKQNTLDYMQKTGLSHQ
jgi:hypothetical protein